ncbi:MAG: glycosyltransferase [Streptosporangiaceae bacterium]|jgi:cellulose synthase/poly-beta-1,6-N-acetylglucosamine synthase-like glycosyltransferase/GGDEF domain-containing protein
MSPKSGVPVMSAAPADPASVLIVGGTAATHQAAASLELAGVTIISAASGRDALERVTDLAPDLVVIGKGKTHDVADDGAVHRLRARSGNRPPVVVIGRPESAGGDFGAGSDDDRPAAGEDYLPADVGAAELVDHIRARLHRLSPPTAAPRRPAVAAQRLGEEIGRELQRAELSQRPGVLAAVGVAELPQLRERLGAHAEQAVAAAFDELFALDAGVLEQHSARAGGGFWLLMPETDSVAARSRLERLARRVAGAVLDVAGEQVRMTPVIGYAPYAHAASTRELCDRADTALQDACLHLDLVPVRFSLGLAGPAVPVAKRDRLLWLVERLRSPLEVVFTMAVLLSLPFIVYVMVWYAGFDLTAVTYPLMAAALACTAAALWMESFQAVGAVEVPAGGGGPSPPATAIIAAYLPNEAATIVDTVTHLLSQDYPGGFQVILAYNAPQRLPIEDALEELAARDSRLLLLRVEASTSKAQNVNAALAYVRGEFVGIFDADHHPAQGSFSRAWRWLSDGHDVVQGHCVVRNGDASWVARMIAVEFETIYAVSHPGRARLHGFGIFGGSNGYWRRDALRQIRMQRMLTEDIEASMRSLRAGFNIVSDPGLVSTELAPTTLGALWHQRMRWAQGWSQTARRHLRPALTSDRLSGRQKLGAAFLLGWAQVVPWVTVQVIPILGFTAWRDGGLGRLNWLIPLFVLLSIFTLSAGGAQTIFAYMLGDPRIRRHRAWFVLYAIHSMLWFGEFKNLIARVAQLKEVTGERQWRVTPRSAATPGAHANGRHAGGADPAERPPRPTVRAG